MAGFFKSGQRVARAVAALAGFALALSGLARASDLLDVRFGPKPDETRIVFDLMGAPDYRVSGDEAGAGRIFVDFSSLEGSLAARGGRGHIADVSFVKIGGSRVRAVVNFKKTAKIKDLFVLDPQGGVTKHRLVIDVATADKKALMASLPASKDDIADIIAQVAPDEAAASEVARKTASLSPPPAPSRKDAEAAADEKKIVVIDPGHGGRDPGALGQSGTQEKNVTLAAAKALAELLEARGDYKVVMTRNEDETIRPDARETLARAAGADLFISLHADAIDQHAVRGGSVYTLAEESTARTAKLAKSQGDYHVFDVALNDYESIAGILLDKAQEKTMSESSKFAELLIHNLSGKTPLLNRSHRKGDLRVLLAADVPAVLFEMAFISNAKDEANLNSPVWRERAMTAVAASIDSYFEGVTLQRHAQYAPAAGQ
ncbi:N-acetylmuramoyl-L-alanine amidase [Hyphococcus luteus]|nr:N-acetylmuramoyl-L-alanine amidase [Marinicaulis flavus]